MDFVSGLFLSGSAGASPSQPVKTKLTDHIERVQTLFDGRWPASETAIPDKFLMAVGFQRKLEVLKKL